MGNFKFLLVLFLGVSFSSMAQSQKEAYLDKVQTLDDTLATLYGVISGEKGEQRNWELFQFLFHPDAKLMPSVKNQKGQVTARYLSVDDYIGVAGKSLVENGFFETEIHRITDSFGPITQVFSTYESFRSKKDDIPFMRGINSIQLLDDGSRWWIMNIYWTQESEENPIPKKYLPKH
ncbi:hypothetical protein [Sediminicola arcticus]|jgi:hypothetical protein|uniref:Nuclear transport factor 2 family protein n=1 Tax=Sediminicola arcticus TaxID=1574308 RepID=A0ABV2SVS6_9FLAO